MENQGDVILNKISNFMFGNEDEKTFIDLLNTFPKIFGYEKQDKNLKKYLSSIEIKLDNICGKELKNIGAWKCENCKKDDSCIICMVCYEKSNDRHEGHKVLFKPMVSGCCDCGDPDAWEPSGSCPSHQGVFQNEDEIKDYINKSFNLDKQSEIRK